MKFVLASASPARRRLLEAAGIPPVVVPGSFDEGSIAFESPETYVLTLARSKAEHVLAEPMRLPQEELLLLACDSVLIFEGKVHGKPADEADAVRRWRSMSGKSGDLFTGHILHAVRDGRITASSERVVRTEVQFAGVTETEIQAYAASGEPLRCAGAFALEGLGGLFVKEIRGCHSNVIGLSLPALREMMADLGASPVQFWT